MLRPPRSDALAKHHARARSQRREAQRLEQRQGLRAASARVHECRLVWTDDRRRPAKEAQGDLTRQRDPGTDVARPRPAPDHDEPFHGAARASTDETTLLVL